MASLKLAHAESGNSFFRLITVCIDNVIDNHGSVYLEMCGHAGNQ